MNSNDDFLILGKRTIPQGTQDTPVTPIDTEYVEGDDEELELVPDEFLEFDEEGADTTFNPHGRVRDWFLNTSHP
jgi:hypothetical protein